MNSYKIHQTLDSLAAGNLRLVEAASILAGPDYCGMPLWPRAYRGLRDLALGRSFTVIVREMLLAGPPVVRDAPRFNYDLQAWISNGRVENCSHPASMSSPDRPCCNQRRLAGMSEQDAMAIA